MGVSVGLSRTVEAPKLTFLMGLGSRVCSDVIWVVVKIMVSSWIPIVIRHQIFRVPKKGP